MKIKYTPQPITDEVEGKEVTRENPYTGTVEIEVPNYKGRLLLIKDMKIKYGADGKIDMSSDPIDQAIKMVELAEKHTVKLELKHRSGQVIVDMDGLQYSRDGSAMMNEIAATVLGGATVGNDSGS